MHFSYFITIQIQDVFFSPFGLNLFLLREMCYAICETKYFNPVLSGAVSCYGIL